jgi:hypothetical protein
LVKHGFHVFPKRGREVNHFLWIHEGFPFISSDLSLEDFLMVEGDESFFSKSTLARGHFIYSGFQACDFAFVLRDVDR